jgi:hypothetical protein
LLRQTFTQQLKSAGWCISKFDDMFFPTLGNTIRRTVQYSSWDSLLLHVLHQTA